MINLGEFAGYTVTVNQSNVEPSLVTYHLYRDGVEYGFSREDCVPLGSPYAEAAKKYGFLGRPNAGKFDPNFSG